VFKPKLRIEAQLAETFGAPDLEDNAGINGSSGPDTTIWLFLHWSNVKGWGKTGKKRLKLEVLLNALVHPMGSHPGGSSSGGVKINPLRACARALSQYRAVASWTRPGMCRTMKL